MLPAFEVVFVEKLGERERRGGARQCFCRLVRPDPTSASSLLQREHAVKRPLERASPRLSTIMRRPLAARTS